MTVYSDNKEFKTNIFTSFILSAVLLIACLCILFFCPQKEVDDIAFIEEEDVLPQPNEVALEIAYTANFLTDPKGNANFIPGFDSYYIKDYLNYEVGNSGDKGLDYYRNPKTRGAVEWFYLRVTGRREITFAILEAADRENIPLSLAFALAYTESRFKRTAINKNTNGSIDRGLFQLNDRSFPQLEESDFFNPDVSAQYGMRHLRFCRGIAKDDFVACAMYNAGVTRVKNNQTPKSTLNYVSNIAKYKARLDTDFERDVCSMFDDDVFMVE